MASTPASMFHIVTTGLQDLERLNPPKGKPTVQFYRSVFMKRTRWASQWRRVDFDNLADFGRKATVTLPQLGELISRVVLVVDLPDIFTVQRKAYLASLPEFGGIQDPLIGPFWNWTNGLGNAICSTMELTIGDQVVDRLDSRMMEILDEQTQPVEHFDSTNTLIYRNPSDYDNISRYIPPADKQPITLEIIPPFWFNRGPGPQAFPIQALAKDKVQITVDFRPIQQCVYSDARIDSRNPPLSANQGVGPLPNIEGCGFFYREPGSTVPIYNMSKLIDAFLDPPSNTFNGGLLPGHTMPSAYHFRDAYWIVEYISLEDREASAFRQADLQITIEQHVAVPPVETGGASSLRIALNEVGLVRDLTWVCQRVEAPSYNAYFLFSRDLAAAGASGSFIPWWPDAVIPNWDYGDGVIQPAFMTRNSDPLKAATLWYRGARRFDNEAPSFFRALVPAQNCKRAPLIDRYIYRYDFGFWPTGGIANALTAPVDQVRGFSNWDKVTKKELELLVDNGSCGPATFIPDPDQAAVTFTEAAPLGDFVSNFSSATQAFQVTLVGSGDAANQGAGASVIGIFDYQQLRRLPNFQNVITRVVPGGSASLAIQTFDGTAFGYQWLAVAGAGGAGSASYSGGDASSAVAVAQQGGTGTITHDASYGPVSTLYSNDISGYTIANQNGFLSPPYTVTVSGTITGPRILTGLLGSGQIEVKLFVNGIEKHQSFIGPGSTSIAWVYLILIAPIPVVPGDVVTITHSFLGSPFIYYDAALNGPTFCIAEFTVSGTQVTFGGGGGGRLSTLGIGQPDGQRMEVTQSFVMSTQQTGGSTNGFQGGDGYTGGGSGALAGGGGGSYVSRFMTQVTTEDGTNVGPASILVQPLISVPSPKLNYDVYAWLTTYNILRITGGRGALLFSA